MHSHMVITLSAVHNLLHWVCPYRVPDAEEMILNRLGFIFLAYRVNYWWLECLLFLVIHIVSGFASSYMAG